ncbi:MAG: hypothetical protein NVSMB45_13790 [Ginsengibacter sp.]
MENHNPENNHNSKIIETSQGQGTEESINKEVGHIIVELIEYVPNSILSKTIMRKSTGNVVVSSVDDGEAFTEKISPFDTFIQIIEGKAEIIIRKKSNMLLCGQGIIIPAHASHIIRAEGRFKMLQTVIKSGYE